MFLLFLSLLRFFFLFFFSSRRRHTRSLCDWSSDVCSSDLFFGNASPRNAAPPTVSLSALPPSDRASTRPPHPAGPDARASRRGRSEEHTSELQSHSDLVCRLLLEKQKTYVR